MLLSALLMVTLAGSTSPSDAERAGEALLRLETLARADGGQAALAARRDDLIASSPPVVAALLRRLRIEDATRRLDFAAADRDIAALGAPPELRCVGPRENTGGQALATASDVDDVGRALAAPDDAGVPSSFIVTRGPQGLFAVDDQLVMRRDVRVRCFVAVRA